MSYTRTKKRMAKMVIFAAREMDVKLLEAAAEREEVSRSEFLRVALRERAARVLRPRADVHRDVAVANV